MSAYPFARERRKHICLDGISGLLRVADRECRPTRPWINATHARPTVKSPLNHTRQQTNFSGISAGEFSPGILCMNDPSTVEQTRRWFVTWAAVLLGVGILMVHSSSVTSRPTNFELVHLSRHLIFLTIGLAAAFVSALIPPRLWKRLAPWLFFVTLVLLVLVLIPGLGTRVKGAQRWLRLGPVSMQPSELAKVTLPLFLGVLLERYRPLLRSWVTGPCLFVMPLVLMVPLVVLEPDLGTALFLCGGGATVLWLSGFPLRNFLAGIAALIPAVVYLVIHKPYQLQRITGFVATWSNFDKAPYQIQQSLATMGAGGIWGVGLGKGWQKLSFLPEANTDFVFAVIGEELGLLGTVSVVGLWGGLLVTGLKLLAPFPRGSFERVVGTTLLLQIVFQAALNVAVVTALVPPKGISHPLISCGGSNLVASLISLGLILGLSVTGRVPESTEIQDEGKYQREPKEPEQPVPSPTVPVAPPKTTRLISNPPTPVAEEPTETAPNPKEPLKGPTRRRVKTPQVTPEGQSTPAAEPSKSGKSRNSARST